MGLLDNFANAPAESGFNDALLAAAQALLTPRARGGGMGAAFGAFPAAMNRAQAREMQKRIFGLQEQKLGYEMSEAERKRASEEAARVARMEFLSQVQRDGGFKPHMATQGLAAGFKPEELEKLARADRWGLDKAEFVNGVPMNPYSLEVMGQPVPNANDPFRLTMGPDRQLQSVANEPVQAFQLARAHAGAARNQNTAIFKQEGEEAKTVGKFFGDAYANIQTSGFEAGSKIAKLNRMEQLLSGLKTGALTPMAVQVKGVLESFGIKVDDSLGAAQAAEALSNEMALQARNPSGGAGMPGALSDKDRDFLVKITPGLSKTPEGNRIVIETHRRLAKRDQEVAQLAREYRKKRGQLDEGFYDELQQRFGGVSLFDDLAVPDSAPGGGASGGWSIRRK